MLLFHDLPVIWPNNCLLLFLKMNTLDIQKKKTAKRFFEDDKKHAAQAIRDAQFIAFAPYVFHASVILRDKGILAYVEEGRAEGRTIKQVADHAVMPYYGVRVLMEAGLGIGLLFLSTTLWPASIQISCAMCVKREPLTSKLPSWMASQMA